MSLTTKEYMGKYNIKSKQTIYNHEKEGKIRVLIRKMEHLLIPIVSKMKKQKILF